MIFTAKLTNPILTNKHFLKHGLIFSALRSSLISQSSVQLETRGFNSYATADSSLRFKHCIKVEKGIIVKIKT